MKLYGKFIIALCIIAVVLIAGKVIRSRFWDTERIEKSVRSEVPIGSSEKFVSEWLRESGIPQEQITKANSKMLKNDTGLTSAQLKNVIIGGVVQEGYPFADLYNIEVYFFFDKNKKLVSYNFYKVWSGM